MAEGAKRGTVDTVHTAEPFEDTDEAAPPQDAATTTGEAERPTASPTPGQPTKSAARFAVKSPRARAATAATGTTRTSTTSKLVKGGQAVKKGSDLIRSRVASLLSLVAVLAAAVLAVGALFYALDANMKNDTVISVLELAHRLDGPFWRIFEFHRDNKGPGPGPRDATKEHLVNWGLAAVAYLIAGRVLDRAIRP